MNTRRAMRTALAPYSALESVDSSTYKAPALGRVDMKIQWEYEEKDLVRVRDLMGRMRDSYLVQHRIACNVTGEARQNLNAELVWYALVSCLLTTQQRSGPTSRVNKLICARPFPLSLEACRRAKDAEALVSVVATQWGIRRGPTIARELAANLTWLDEADGWARVMSRLHSLAACPGRAAERSAARQIAAWFSGCGPKQARNLMQMLGLSQHEIPLDSRVVKWLNAGGFPIPLVAEALSGEEYYAFVMDRVQELCDAAQVLPCVLDAVVFASADRDAWTPENHVW